MPFLLPPWGGSKLFEIMDLRLLWANGRGL